MNHILLLLAVVGVGFVAAVGVCIYAFNRLLDEMEAEHYHEEPYQ